MRINQLAVWAAALIVQATAHGHHGQDPIMTEDHDWASRHMAEEHHIQGFDATTFFKLHCFSTSETWSPEDIRRMYGLYDKTTEHVPEATKINATRQIIHMYDTNNDGIITLDEFLAGFEKKGTRLPDLGFGPGHHGDDEYEYEIHHWEKYHGDDTKEEDLTHPEDIEHFKMHEEQDRQEEEWQKKFATYEIIEDNIPEKYRRREV